jgi:peptide/nickel transport system substrate-binding protein
MRHERAWYLRLFALATVLVIALAACGGDDDDSEGGGGAASTSEGGGGEVPQGGELVIGAEQEPDCVAWIKSCSGSSWGYWMMGVSTMPRSYDTVKEGDGWAVEYNKDLLTEEPQIDTTDPAKPVVTYKINPDAVWSDDTPITCDDFAFTWDAIANGEDSYDPTGYTDIESVNCPDPQTATVTFAQPYSGWKQLFGGQYGIQPKHLLEGKDITAEMSNGYSWSGGPWMIDHWTKGVEVVLVPNENFWGTKPKLDRVTFKIQADTAAEFESFQNNEVSMIYPQPQLDVLDQIEAGLPDAQSSYLSTTASLEALWMNNASPPLDDPAVRQALGYSIDRAAIVKQLFGALGIDEPMQTLQAPIFADWADTEAWSQYEVDLDKVDDLMTGAGWAKNGSGIWAKGGQTATLTIKTTAGNARRELTEQILQQQLKEAGFEISTDNQEAGALFGEQLPAGQFQLAVYAQVNTFIAPGQCNLFCAKNIPSDANGNSGQNWTRTNIPDAEAPLAAGDTELDEANQKEAGKQADKLLAEVNTSLPIDPLPNILIWKNSVAGEIGDNPILGPFHNLNEIGVNQ